jgi:hypothetical protein
MTDRAGYHGMDGHLPCALSLSGYSSARLGGTPVIFPAGMHPPHCCMRRPSHAASSPPSHAFVRRARALV